MAVSDAQRRATAKYERENYDKVLIRFPKGIKGDIRRYSDSSINGFVIKAVEEKLMRLGKGEDFELPECFR